MLMKHRDERAEEKQKEKDEFKPALEEIHVQDIKPKKLSGLDLIMMKKGRGKH